METFVNSAIDSSCWHRISPVNFYSQAKTLFIWCFLGSCYTLYTMCERVRGMTINLDVWQCCYMYFQIINWGKVILLHFYGQKKVTEHSAINLNTCIKFLCPFLYNMHLNLCKNFVTWLCNIFNILYMTQFTNFTVVKCAN